MQPKRSLSWNLIPRDPLERICYFWSAIVVALVLVELLGCATAPPPPPKEITCLLRAPKTPDDQAPGDPATPGILECYNPANNHGFEVPLTEADKYVCRPPGSQREFDLYLKLRGL